MDDRHPTLRPATAADLEAVFALVQRCIAAMRAQGIEQWDDVYPRREVFARDLAAGGLLIAEVDNRMVGAVVLDADQPEAYRTVGWRFRPERIGAVHRLMIEPDLQGHGLATRVMGALEPVAMARGFRALRLDAFIHSPAALRLYERLGYRRAGTVTFRKGEFVCFEKALPGRGPAEGGV